jgi:hypothetical protein
MKHYAEFNAVYNTYFNAQTGPTRTTIAVKEVSCSLRLSFLCKVLRC